MTIGRGAPVACASGSHDCWEAFASERAALARYAQRSGSNGNSNGNSDINFSGLMNRALAGETPAREALKETAYYLGVGISNLIRGLAPEAVIVGGPIVRAWNLIVDDVRATVESSTCQGLPSTPLIASPLGSH